MNELFRNCYNNLIKIQTQTQSMDQPPRKLWRKIGLEKNFLEGTSHSDQSKNTLSQLQSSLIKAHSVLSQKPSDHQNFKIKQHKHQDDFGYQKNGKIQKQGQFVENYRPQTPIDQLNSSNFEQRYILWEDQVNKNDSFEPFQENEQKYNSLKKIPYYLDKLQKQKGNIIEPSKNFQSMKVEKEKYFKEKEMSKGQIQELKIRLYGEQESKQLQHNFQNPYVAQSRSRQYKYTLQIQPKQLERYQKEESTINRLKLDLVPQALERVLFIKRHFEQQKKQISEELISMRRFLQSMIRNEFLQQFQQYTDEIGYLYSQNKELMDKIQQKQSALKKQSQQFSKIQTKLSQLQSTKSSQTSQQQSIIISLQNQVNQLQQKLQDIEQLQSNYQSIKKKLSQTQKQLQSSLANQSKLNDIIKEKTVESTSKQIKNQELQWQINQLYIKNEELQYKLKKEYTEQFDKMENDHVQRLNLEKSFFDKERNKCKELQALLVVYEPVLEQLIKNLSKFTAESIAKKMNIQKSQHLKNIFEKAIKECSDHNRSHDKTFFFHGQPNQLSPRSQTDSIYESNKNLRRTGFFGEVGKPNLAFKLDDIQKRFSAQISEAEQHFIEQKRQKYQENPYQNRKFMKCDTFSEISEQSIPRQIPREQFSHHNRPPSSYRQEQTKRQHSRQKHQRYQSDKFHNNRSPQSSEIYEDLNRIKSSFNDGYDDSFSNSLSYRNNLKNIENPNYSFSQTNYFNQQQDIDDQSSVTTYEKSQSQRPSSRYSYDRQPNPQNSQRNEIVEKIKQRVKERFRSKGKAELEPTYNNSSGFDAISQHRKRPSESDYDNPVRPPPKEDLILADFYQRHAMQNTSSLMNQNTSVPPRRVSPHSPSRSPSQTRSRSPSNASSSRISQTNPTSRITSTIPRPITSNITPKYTASTINSGSHTGITKPLSQLPNRSVFSKSLIQKPQFVSYSRKVNEGYHPKSTLYSTLNRGQSHNTSSYSKKY